jgi:hypothetical protein
MAIKGFQRTRTKPQNLREIVQSQDGFLGGMNKDLPKSDVGDTQVTGLRNCLPFRDRIEARGGIKPQTAYLKKSDTNTALAFESGVAPFYDPEFDEFFYNDDGNLINYGKQDRETTHCFGYNLKLGISVDQSGDYRRIKEGFFFSTWTQLGLIFRNHFIEYRSGKDDYFLRPLVFDSGYVGSINVDRAGGSNGPFSYVFVSSFVRIVDGSVVAESGLQDAVTHTLLVPLDGTFFPFVLDNTAYYPDGYFDTSYTGEDNFYTHVRYYRSANGGDTFYYVGDYELNDIPTLPATGVGGGPTLDLNVSDQALTSDPSRAVYWQEGYQPIGGTGIACSSNGIFLARNEQRKNEFVYSPIGAGDNRKYLGWYNPLFQYGSVDGEITQMLDMGSYVVITTKDKTYYVDTSNYTEDEGQIQSRIFTPILRSSVLISDRVGVGVNQKNAFVKTSTSSAIAITADGEIREFSGYTWGPDLAADKIKSITKGVISNGDLYCQGTYVNESFYFGYYSNFNTNTIRLGLTEESGNGFNEIGDGGWNPSDFSGSIISFVRYFFNVQGILNVYNGQNLFDTIPPGANPNMKQMYEYTGDKFDKKLNKDVLDFYDDSRVYQDTVYYDIEAEIEFPEVIGNSEAYFLYFMKSHFYLRKDRFAYKVADEDTKGYEITDDVGTGIGDIATITLDDVEFGMDVSIGEDESIFASNDNFTPTSAVVIQREVQDHRIRVILRADSSGFQLTGMESHFKRHDRTEFDSTDTIDSITDLSTGMFFHLNENIKNLCVGVTRAATFDSGTPINGALLGKSPDPFLESGFVTVLLGPDVSSLTGLDFSSAKIEFQAPSVGSVAFVTIMFWHFFYNLDIYTGWTPEGENQYRFFSDGTFFNIESDSGVITTSTPIDAGNWNHTAFIYDGTKWNVYRNGVLNFSSSSIGIENWIKSQSIRIEGSGRLSDVRMYNKALSQKDLELYYNNILNNSGDYLDGY